MSSREREFVSKHRDSLRTARECCDALKMNAVEPAPRGALYLKLARANKELEGTCRQMFHWRGDDTRWLRLAALYVKSQKIAARLLATEKWPLFAELALIYERGLRDLDDLAERPTGRSLSSLILPGDISPWYEPPKRGIQ